MGREVEGRFMLRNACTPVVDSCQYVENQYNSIKQNKVKTKIKKKKKESACNTEDLGSIPGLGENGKPLQYSCLENPVDRKDQCTTVHGVAVRLDFHFHFWVMKRANQPRVTMDRKVEVLP